MSWYMEWMGCIFGAVGALMLATNTRISGWGFVLFLVSNACWIAFGVIEGRPSIYFMQVIMTGTSLLGVFRWIYQPGRANFRARKVKEAPQC